MITKMKKYSYFIFEPEYHSFLCELRDLGVVHVQESRSTKEIERIQTINDELSEVENLRKRMERLEKMASAEEQVPEITITDYATFKSEVESLEARIAQTQKDLEITRGQMRDFETWGDFDPELIDRLAANGYYLHFWTVLTSQYNPEWEELFNAEVINQAGRSTYFITVTRDPKGPGLEYAEQIVLPKTTIGALEVRRNTLMTEIETLNSELLAHARNMEIVDRREVELRNEHKLDSAYYQGEKLYDNKLVILEGWVPGEQSSEMEHSLDTKGYAYSHLEIQEGESVPIKLKNNRFNKVFEPILEMFDLPNYWEFDPTPLFAPFFLLFFGMCFGDSGYGLLLLLVATYFKAKVKPSAKGSLELLQWLGLSAGVIGFFSGSFFGIELIKVPFLQSIKGFFLSTDNLMVISLVLGLVQILFAKYISAMKMKMQSGVPASLSAFAWPTLIIMGAVLFGLPKLNLTLPSVVEYILMGTAGLCVLIVFFYNTPGKNIFLNFGKGLWDTYNMASGLLGDTLSYIRLFAIGLTGAILGQVFNTIAETATSGLPWYGAIPVGFLILIFGHSINFGLAMIGALVHPVRLIYVEYFKNSEYEGGGKKYDPLRTLSTEDK